MKIALLTAERQIIWTGALVLGLFALLQGMWYLTARASREADQRVQHALDVQNELDRLLVALQDLESGYRGFVITADDAFLTSTAAVEREAYERIQRLAALTADNDAQRQRLAELRQLLDRKVAFAHAVIDARRAGGFEEAQPLVISGDGRRTMEGTRAVIEQMRTLESGDLAVFRADAAARNRATGYVAALAAIVLAGAAAVFLVFARRDLARRHAITEALRQSEATLRVSAEKLQRSNRDLQDFAMIASHDLQEPLRKIRMFGERLLDEAGPSLSPDAADYLSRMRNAAERGQSLIDGLLAYSRVTTKAQAPSPVALGDVARDVVGDLDAWISQTGGEVIIDQLPTIEADPLQMRQLFQNLIGNALKFRAPDRPPRIELRARPVDFSADHSPEMWMIEVADNGLGFDEKYRDRIFKLFQRLHERGQHDGSGMGLAICRRIAERHNGAITARSTPGTGSTFIILLPSRQPAEETS